MSRTYEANERVLLVICFANFYHHFEYKGGDVPHLQKRMKDHKHPAAEQYADFVLKAHLNLFLHPLSNNIVRSINVISLMSSSQHLFLTQSKMFKLNTYRKSM